MDISIGTVIFYFLALVLVVSAAGVAFSPNIVYSAFSLVGTFGGVAGLYVMLGADFVAGVQILIYVGGILVLILFAVMLTHRISEIHLSNRAVGRIPALLLCGITLALLIMTIMKNPWAKAAKIDYEPTTSRIGDLFLENYLLPFELASIVLLVALIGAVIISRKEIRE